MSNTFSTTITNWQGVDDVPTDGSDNLVKSGGVANAIETETARAMAAEQANAQAIKDEVAQVVAENKTEIIRVNRGIISSGYFMKNQNIAFSSASFFKHGYYAQQGYFQEANSTWGWEWTLVFIPIVKDIEFTVKTSNKPNNNVCRIFFVRENLSISTSYEYEKNIETVVTSQEGDAYIVVQYSDDMYVKPNKPYKYLSLKGKIENETQERTQADKQLNNKVDTITNKVDTITNKVDIIKSEVSDLYNSIPLSNLYFKNKNLILNPLNFSKYGWYSDIKTGTLFTTVDTPSILGLEYTTIFIPVKNGITYTVTNAGGWDNNRKIVMTDVELNVTHGIECTENEITALDGDVYIAVIYGSDVRCSLTYEIGFNTILSKNQAEEAKTISIENLFKIDGIVKADNDYSHCCKIKKGYYNNDGSFNANPYSSSWCTVIIPIEPLKTYKWKINKCVNNTNHAILDKEKNPVKLLPISAYNQYNPEQTLEAEENHYYFALQRDGSDASYYFKPTEDIKIESIGLSKDVKKNASDIEQIQQEIGQIQAVGEKKEFSVINIPYIFGMANSVLYSREYVVRLFPESFLDVKPDVPALVNYRRDVAINRKAKTTTLYEKINKEIILSADGYNNKTVSLDFHVMNERVFADKNIRLCLFGVSTDDNDFKNDDGSNDKGGTTTTAILEKYIRMAAKDNSYNVNYVSIGTKKHNYGNTFQYNDSTLNSRGMSEARAGNNGICYLRQPMNFSPSNIDYDPNVSGTSATGIIQWFMNGLRYRVPYNQEYSTSGTDYGIFEKSTDKLEALRCTPFGKYHHDYAIELWEFCNKKGYIKAVGETYNDWADTQEQRHIIDLCMDYISTHPEYPFYDIETARETSFNGDIIKDVDDETQYSFNYNKYLERYRTMDDLGVRLVITDDNPAGKKVIGSDNIEYIVGTNIISQELLNSFDVCTPTHVIWDMSYNDWGYYNWSTYYNSGEAALSEAELFINIIRQQINDSIIFGLKAKKENGAFFPDVWGDICLGQSYSATGMNINYNKLLIGKYADLSQKVSWIPTFPVAIPFSINYTQEFNDFVYDKALVGSIGALTSTTDSTHGGLRSCKSQTYQIYGWLAYTVKDWT